MDYIDSFISILEALQSGNNESIQQALDGYTEMLNENPEELVSIHFQIISSTENEQYRDQALVLLGIYFTLLKQNEKEISSEDSERIKSSLLLLFQDENFTQYHFGILSNIIFKSAQYFKNNWPELSDELYSLLMQPDSVISSTAATCLSYCIKSDLIDLDNYSVALLKFVHESLSSPPEPIDIQINSVLQLFYSIASSTKYYDQKEILISIANLIPDFLTISHEDPVIINDFYFFVSNHMFLFLDSNQRCFQILTDIISSEDFTPAIKNTSIFIVYDLIFHFPSNFFSQSNLIFDFFTDEQIISQSEIHESCVFLISELANKYGGNPDYAVHVFEFFQNNAPNPISYIVMGSSYKGIKDHFANCAFSDELLQLYIQGFKSEEDLERLKAFQYFIPLVDIFYFYDDKTSLRDAISTLLDSICDENNFEVLYEEIKMLSKLLKHYINQFTGILESIIILLNELVNIEDEGARFTLKIFSCYKMIALSKKEEFLPLSQQFVLKISQFIENPQENEEIFYYCIKILPSFNSAIPEENFNELMESIFDFIFSTVYDDDMNLKDENCLSKYGKFSIIKFFLDCINNEINIDSPEIIKKIVLLCLKDASDDIEYETVDADSDISIYENYKIFPNIEEKKFTIFDFNDIKKIRNCLIILYHIFSGEDEELIELYADDLYNLSIKLIQTLFFEEVFSNIFNLEKLFLPFIQDEKSFLLLLILSADKSYNLSLNMYTLNQFVKLLRTFIKIVAEKWSENEDFIKYLLLYNYNFFRLVYVKCDNDKLVATSIQNYTYDGKEGLAAKINLALNYREIFRYYPILSTEFFPTLFDLIDGFQKNQENKKTVASIIYSDFIRFCHPENPEFFGTINDFFKQGLESESISVQLDSIYGLSSIMSPIYLDADSMISFVDNLIELTQDKNSEINSMVCFALLQIFQNYYSEFDFSNYISQFIDLIQFEIFRIPKYCLEYYAQCLAFFIENFRDSIPEDQVEKFVIIIKKLLLKKLNAELMEELNSILESFSNCD